MQKYLLSLYLLLGTITLYSQEVTKIANFDLFTWQEKPCKYDTKKKNHLWVKNGEMRIVSNKYPNIKHFRLKELQHNNTYRIVTTRTTKSFSLPFSSNYWIADTIIQTSKQLTMFRCIKSDDKSFDAIYVRWLTQLDSTHWELKEKLYEHELFFKDFLLAFEQNRLEAYLDRMQAEKEDSRPLNSYQDNMAFLEANKAENSFSIKATNSITKKEFNITFTIFKYNISLEWLLLNSFLQTSFPSYPDYYPFGY